MRKIKHWGGYGCVRAGKVKDNTCSLHVRVEGEHELGLTRPSWDPETIYYWLVHRFDKYAPDRYDSITMQVKQVSGYIKKDGHYTDTADFYFFY